MKALFSAFFLSGLLASAGRPLAGQDFFRMHLGDAIHDHFGASARGLGDLDGDGLGDYAVGATQGGLNDGGYVRVFSGADGSVLLTLEGAAPGDRFGTSLGPLGDLDGDGIPDFLVGAPGADSRGIDAGSVLIFSGRDGLLLRTVIGDYQNDEFGSSVCAAGDLDGDGLPDFIAGAIQPEFRQFGYARVVSGGTGQPIFTFLGEGKNDEFGSTVLGGLDLDGDPAGDLLVAAPREGARAGGVWAFSGADGLLLAHIRGSLDSQLGSELAVPGDAD
ncbi:MAG: integrin alpha, partial [Nitrospinota bacterium]